MGHEKHPSKSKDKQTNSQRPRDHHNQHTSGSDANATQHSANTYWEQDAPQQPHEIGGYRNTAQWQQDPQRPWNAHRNEADSYAQCSDYNYQHQEFNNTDYPPSVATQGSATEGNNGYQGHHGQHGHHSHHPSNGHHGSSRRDDTKKTSKRK